MADFGSRNMGFFGGSGGGGTPITLPLAVSDGGTGVTTSSGANSVVLRDANGNITANAILDGFSNTVASGTPIVLTASSVNSYNVSGSGGQTIQLPDATTLANGVVYLFNNNQSSGAILVNNNSSTLIVSVPSGGFVTLTLLSNSISAGSWDRHDQAPANVSWSTNTLDYAGSITSATWNGNTVAINRGGTNSNTALNNNCVIISSGGKIIEGNTTTYPSTTELSYVKGVTSAIQTQIDGKQATIGTLPIANGGTNSNTALNNNCVIISSGGKLIEGDTTTYPSTTELSYVKGVTSAIQTQINNKPSNTEIVSGYQGLGSTIKASPLGLNLALNISTQTQLTTASLRLMPVYLSAPATITGVKWYQSIIGSYTANNYNGVGLYSVSGGTITLIASSTNDGTIWQTFATGSWGNKAFSSPLSNLSAGTYFIGILWNASATTTAPSVQTIASSSASIQSFDFTGGKLATLLSSQNTLPSSITLSTTTNSGVSYWLSLY